MKAPPPRRLAPTTVVVCVPLRAMLSAASCATRHAARFPSGRRRGAVRFLPCGTCPLGAAVLVQLERGGWKRPPDSFPAEVPDVAQRAARELWQRSFTAFREPLGEVADPLRVAAQLAPEDRGVGMDGAGLG